MNYLSLTRKFIDDFKFAQEDFKERVLEEWEETKKLPRKKKKAKRKQLNLKWQIANYKPFNLDF